MNSVASPWHCSSVLLVTVQYYLPLSFSPFMMGRNEIVSNFIDYPLGAEARNCCFHIFQQFKI